jgi:hypothetical protein
MNRTVWITVLVAVSALLAGCESTKKVLGLEKRSPDEFAVYSRAPLSLPPDYNLRPPAPGETRPQEVTPTTQAEQALRGGTGRNPQMTAPPPAGSTAGVKALLRETGGLNAPPNIRTLVNEETSQLALENKRITDKILFWKKPEPEGVVVDAQKETRRIRENQALGRPITDGDTPSIKRRGRGLF